MKLYSMMYTQCLPLSLEEAWSFFSSPTNLQKITPPKLDFTITSDLVKSMYAGMIITYRIKVLLGLPLTWVTEITQVREPHYFIDEQRFGPYRFWHHQHFFREIENGVEMKDIVHYALYGSFFGSLIHKVVVQKELEDIFRFREKKLESLFGKIVSSR